MASAQLLFHWSPLYCGQGLVIVLVVEGAPFSPFHHVLRTVESIIIRTQSGVSEAEKRKSGHRKCKRIQCISCLWAARIMERGRCNRFLTDVFPSSGVWSLKGREGKGGCHMSHDDNVRLFMATRSRRCLDSTRTPHWIGLGLTGHQLSLKT